MNVLKFGGTSVGSAERIQKVAELLLQQEKPMIAVCSAMSGATDALVEIAKSLYNNKKDVANKQITELERKHLDTVKQLLSTDKYLQIGEDYVKNRFEYIRSFTLDMFTLYEEKAVLAQGELLSTAFLSYYLEEQGHQNQLISALNFMRIDKEGEPDNYYIEENLKRELETESPSGIYITQGFICRNAYGEVDNLRRGGSDYSASLIGAAIKVDEIQIWTDIDGFHNNDPRFVENTRTLSALSFDEAAELAYFGAKILHPASILPAQNANINVRLKNTMEPEVPGTLVSSTSSESSVKAVAAKDGITAIKIKSGRMLMAYGFLRRVFEVFESYKTSIDMITTSEVAISLTIDDTTHLDKIVSELETYGVVQVDHNQSIICVVGNFIAKNSGLASEIFTAVSHVPIRMISYGGSKHNVTILVDSSYKKETLNSLNNHLFK